jgi:hypothetical protein
VVYFIVANEKGNGGTLGGMRKKEGRKNHLFHKLGS